METQNKKDRLRGILGTVIFHGILLAAFLFFGFKTPLPLPEEEGIEVRLGNLDEGMGDLNVPPPAFNNVSPSNPQSDDNKMLTQNIEETPQIEKKIDKTIKNENPIKTETVVKNEKTEQLVNPNLLYKQGNKNGANSGLTNKSGYQGSPNGNPNSNNPIGNGGNGVSFSLAGRNSKSLPVPDKNFSVEGTVVVAITVDRNGRVIIATPGAKGSTTTDATLKRLATEAAYKATFDVKPDASEEQKGTITYHFRLN